MNSKKIEIEEVEQKLLKREKLENTGCRWNHCGAAKVWFLIN